MKNLSISILFLTLLIPNISYGNLSSLTGKKESFLASLGKKIEMVLTFGRINKKNNILINNKQDEFENFGSFDNSQLVELSSLPVIEKKVVIKPKKKSVDIQQNKESIVYQNTSTQSKLPSQQAIETTLIKMLRQQCYDAYSTKAQIQANIDKIDDNRKQKEIEREKLVAKIEREISTLENANDTITNTRKMLGTQDKFISEMRGIKYQELENFDIYWDSLHSVIGSTDLSRSREEMCVGL